MAVGHGLHDLARHNAWATAQTLAFCQGLDESTLNSTVPGTFGTVIGTLRHLIDSEAWYLFRLTGVWSAYPWREDDAVGLDVLAERAATLADTWEQFLAGDVDSERLGEARGDEGEVFAVRAGVFITQAVHHANEHRAQIGTILGALGHEPPDVSAWGYALATGRMRQKTMSPALHHVQVAIPAEGEERVRHFYGDLLGFHEVPKPENLRHRGGVWFAAGPLQLHFGVDPNFQPAEKAHVAYHVSGLTELRDRLASAGYQPMDDEPLPGYKRFYVKDPFGNRLEILVPE
jgi:uncharacterized damage-inducible protein DinB/catechol 2,3-dioxygenase-like lactoylglutathione lyase family enzyme